MKWEQQNHDGLVPVFDAARGDAGSSSCNKMPQMELWHFLGLQVQQYTKGESSSVPVETAQDLIHSISWCMGQAPHTGGQTVQEQWKEGQQRIARLVQKGKGLLHVANKTAMNVDNQAYKETLKELPGFFKWYDPRFFAHQIPCDIDYQLSQPVPEELEGILYLNEYLRRLCLENRFCRQFQNRHMIRLLQAYCPDYKGLLINLFEPVFVNALGLRLLGAPAAGLEIDSENREKLQMLLERCDFSQQQALLLRGADALAWDTAGEDPQMAAYLRQAALDLHHRLQIAPENLEGVFLAFLPEYQTETTYVDGLPMAPEQLRYLIEELQECPGSAEKVHLLLAEVHSIRDLTELLHCCFWGDEALALFEQLGDADLARLLCAAGLQESTIGKPDDWVICLNSYLEELEQTRKDTILAIAKAMV